jgi:cytochrome c
MIVVQQGLTRHRWDKTLTWMVEEQGMPEPDEDTRDLILDYLAEHYGPES